jgi:hypothetical protein
MRKALIILLFAMIAASGCIKPEVTIADILGDKEQYTGKEVNVTGVADAGHIKCTLMACAEENPCCNACSGDLILKDGGYAIDIRGGHNGSIVGCGGDDCNIACHPLEKSRKYKVGGIFRAEGSKYFVDLKFFEEVGE